MEQLGKFFCYTLQWKKVVLKMWIEEKAVVF